MIAVIGSRRKRIIRNFKDFADSVDRDNSAIAGLIERGESGEINLTGKIALTHLFDLLGLRFGFCDMRAGFNRVVEDEVWEEGRVRHGLCVVKWKFQRNGQLSSQELRLQDRAGFRIIEWRPRGREDRALGLNKWN
jgi:hypothetical protein